MEMNPWLSIWTRPRATIRAIVESDPRRHVMLLLYAEGFVAAFGATMARGFDDRFGVPAVLIISLAAAGAGLPLAYLSANYGRWIGGLFGGTASSREVRAAIAWSAVPGLEMALVDWPIRLLVLGRDAFSPETQAAGGLPANVITGLDVVNAVVGAWNATISLKAFAEVHHFSAWRALVATVATIALLAVVGLGFAIGVGSLAATWR